MMSVKLIVFGRTGTSIKDKNNLSWAFQQAMKVNGDPQMGYYPAQLTGDISEVLMINQ